MFDKRYFRGVLLGANGLKCFAFLEIIYNTAVFVPEGLVRESSH